MTVKEQQQRTSNRRGMYRYHLAWGWLQMNRPDVRMAIIEESNKKYPKKKGSRKNQIEIPKSISKIGAMPPKE